MSYLEQYDNIPQDQPEEKAKLVNQWIRTADWRPFFKELRENRPIFPIPGNIILVTLFDDVQEIMSRENVFSVKLYARSMDPTIGGAFMLARDNTEINYRDKSIMRTMLQWEDLPLVRKISGEIAKASLDKWAETGKVELVKELGRYVPVRMCGEYFGFPGPDLESMYKWAYATQSDMFKNLGGRNQAVHEASLQAGKEMTAYLGQLLQQKKADIAKNKGCTQDNDSSFIGKDIFTRLVKTQFPQEIDNYFDEHRIIGNVAGLLIGSVETISQAVVQAVEQILLRPNIFQEALSAAQSNDDKTFDKYVWEALRFNPINPLVFRLCEEDYILASGTPRATRISKTSIVFACTASAMFDATELVEPEKFSLDRPNYHYIHFGYGHHTCLGQYVATVEIPEIVKQIILRPGVRLIPGDEGKLDFQGSPFPERFVIAYDC
jgi:cytochrome P450